ncbi:transposase [Clostridium sp. MCC353]|uniref:IS66 family transposase n=1 Tax=Clostridium sp. MCC353 TaxID=2592646 RepID=UPI0031FECCEE
MHEVPANGKLRVGFTYALNQERYLTVFLTDGDVPIDNNASEKAIRVFCVGKKNWQVIDTINGAASSAIIYSIAETVKANNRKPYDYFEYPLTELPKHADDLERSFLEDLLPWSKKLPEHIRKPKKQGSTGCT